MNKEQLSIEENAKAIDVVKQMVTDGQISQEVAEKYFPELKESEGERIRKSLLALIEWSKSYAASGISTDEAKEMTDWIEKQGEHAKFRDSIQVGDKVTRNEDGVLVNLSQLQRVAKPAETYKQGEQKPYGQRQECVDCQFNYAGECKGSCAMKRGEQKPAWSEEDETIVNKILSVFDEFKEAFHGCKIGSPIDIEDLDKIGSWLKSLKDRVQPQPKQEWSEEDEQYLLICENALAKYQVSDKWDAVIISQWLESRLKSLRPQSRWKPSEEQIIALRWVLNNVPYNKHKEEISGLLDQIKEL